ncbi:ATP-dependent helicase [Pedobacter ginsengisoli]|uniref:ATP-dependent helicase n=1 Tax=Pedobacter ginsengisoli TaxID=363852 RepID=UPI002551007E|nr:ATP-dependent helicase [Pedobacter ginsengisoli]
MTEPIESALNSLSPIQRTTAEWGDGAALVLAGPGAGKTRVLTTRIAKLLDDTPDKKFRVLALTFTTKAANEMRERVEFLIPGVSERRTFIGTFHAFCTQILRQHGSHIGISPDFGIFGQKEDQEALLRDALQSEIEDGKDFSLTDICLLPSIRELRSRLVTPEKAYLKNGNQHQKAVYELYEQTLKTQNALDFEGLILESCRLLHQVPAVAARLRQTYPFWMIDEFQDTTPAQYFLLHYLSGGTFKNVFVVADDDQIIYQWAGASYQQILKFKKDYDPEFIQLVENHRCPPEIVTMANQLVGNNKQRSPERKPTLASRTTPLNAAIFTQFETDDLEKASIAQSIADLGEENWGKVAILGRTRHLLEPYLEALKACSVKASMSQRRDNFVSPHFVWLHALLDQAIRPTNRRLFEILTNAANRICKLELDPALLAVEADALGMNHYEHWANIAITSSSVLAQKLGEMANKLARSRITWKKIVDEAIPLLIENANGDEGLSDADEDLIAWNMILKEIRSETGGLPDLPDVVQGIALRSKEPPREPNTVVLMTIHTAKGLEFEYVYFIGLVEGEMPSWQSCRTGDDSREMEEERRNCFVAITRTQEKLHLSAAKSYKNRNKELSRFLKEMSIGDGDC